MTAIYKKELKSYLTSMVGYIFMFFILVMTGIYFTAYNLQSAYPVFGVTLNAVTFIFLIGVPILTMKVLSEERKQKTDQMLLTAPVSVNSIVLGKYLALLTIYLIPMVIISFYPILMKQFGNVSLPMAYTSIIGFLLLGFANISVGLFMSSITESQVIAAVLTFIVLFVSYMSEGIATFFSDSALTSMIAFAVLVFIFAIVVYIMTKNLFAALIAGVVGEIAVTAGYLINASFFEGGIDKIFLLININGHLNNFINGILDLTGVVYFVSLIVVFLFLTVQSISKRRWS